MSSTDQFCTVSSWVWWWSLVVKCSLFCWTNTMNVNIDMDLHQPPPARPTPQSDGILSISSYVIVMEPLWHFWQCVQGSLHIIFTMQYKASYSIKDDHISWQRWVWSCEAFVWLGLTHWTFSEMISTDCNGYVFMSFEWSWVFSKIFPRNWLN